MGVAVLGDGGGLGVLLAWLGVGWLCSNSFSVEFLGAGWE